MSLFCPWKIIHACTLSKEKMVQLEDEMISKYV
jgi:hypothetical protein